LTCPALTRARADPRLRRARLTVPAGLDASRPPHQYPATAGWRGGVNCARA